MIEAKVIADSMGGGAGVPRLTTIQVTMHRFVLAELNTHRVFSRNSASSRAIPVPKQVQRIKDELAWPAVWPAEQKGMQGGESLSEEDIAICRVHWQSAADESTSVANWLSRLGLHKSVANRLLEPFMWHTVVITSTAWANFFALRLDTDAQPEIRLAAEAMKAAYDASTPTFIPDGAWHLPYIQGEDWGEVAKSGHVGLGERMYPWLAKISAARSARTSYLTQEGRRDIDLDLVLYDRLVTDRLDKGLSIHWSPLEHVATPWPQNRQVGQIDFIPVDAEPGEWATVKFDHLPRIGNLLGWRSLRTEVEAQHGVRTYA